MRLSLSKKKKKKTKKTFLLVLNLWFQQEKTLTFKACSSSHYSLMGNGDYMALKYYVLSGCNLPAFWLRMK